MMVNLTYNLTLRRDGGYGKWQRQRRWPSWWLWASLHCGRVTMLVWAAFYTCQPFLRCRWREWGGRPSVSRCTLRPRFHWDGTLTFRCRPTCGESIKIADESRRHIRSVLIKDKKLPVVFGTVIAFTLLMEVRNAAKFLQIGVSGLHHAITVNQPACCIAIELSVLKGSMNRLLSNKYGLYT